MRSDGLHTIWNLLCSSVHIFISHICVQYHKSKASEGRLCRGRVCFPPFHSLIGIPVCAIRREKSKLFCSAALARWRSTSHWGVANHSYIPAGGPTSAWTRPCFVQGLWNAIRNPLRADGASDWMRPPRNPGGLRTLKSCAISPREPIPDSSARHGSKRMMRYKTLGHSHTSPGSFHVSPPTGVLTVIINYVIYLLW